MNQKIGRNDPCSCGSGKKYKQCCQLKAATRSTPRKLTAKWLNPPQMPDLIEKRFGDAISATGKVFETPYKKLEETDSHS